jgi:nicotinamidase-related amidase
MKHFVVVDMQNDFCTGALANKDAVAVIPRIKAELQAAKAEKANIIFTRDTHSENYLETGEGKHLPVKHCVKDTEGWQVVPELMEETDENTLFIDKTHFGFDNWTEYVKEGDEVVICGTCTSICVSANVSALKMIEGVEVKVLCDCCADINEEAHKAGLKVMEMQQAVLI